MILMPDVSTSRNDGSTRTGISASVLMAERRDAILARYLKNNNTRGRFRESVNNVEENYGRYQEPPLISRPYGTQGRIKKQTF
jgi:hypothetical protein